MDGYYKEVLQRLKREGFYRVRPGAGSHQIWGHADGRRVTVSTKTKSRHTANAILKRAKIAHHF